jgi:hypothetical protein
MPEPGGLAVAEAEALVTSVRAQQPILGAGFSGLLADEKNLGPISRLTDVLGL